MLIKTPHDAHDASGLTHDQKVWMAGCGYIKAFVQGLNGLKGPMPFVPAGTLLYAMAEMPESHFIQFMKSGYQIEMTKDFTDRDWGAIHQQIIDACKQLEQAGAAWKRRQGDTFKPSDFRNGKLRT